MRWAALRGGVFDFSAANKLLSSKCQVNEVNIFFSRIFLIFFHFISDGDSSTRLELSEILPEDPTTYSKLVPPFSNISEVNSKMHGESIAYCYDVRTFGKVRNVSKFSDPAIVHLFFYVMAIDSINEASMVIACRPFLFHLIIDSVYFPPRSPSQQTSTSISCGRINVSAIQSA